MLLLHLVGSPTSDFFADLSLLYARDCLAATGSDFDTALAFVTPDGAWRFPVSLDPADLAAAEPMPLADAVATIVELAPTAMVPQMFCLAGMTTYRAMFDLLGIPYLGNTPDVMAVAADKARTRAIVAAAGVAVPAGEVLRRGDVPTLALPVVVKPVDADNSLGVSLVRVPGELADALERAFAESDRVLVETYVELGREVRCGVLVQHGELVCLPLEEYAVADVRAPADKLARDTTGDLTLVAKDVTRAWTLPTDDPVTQPVWDLARRCHEALGCRHYSLFDVRIDPEGRPWFLEAGLYCSFARKSVVSTMALAAGIDLGQLFRTALDSALTPTPTT